MRVWRLQGGTYLIQGGSHLLELVGTDVWAEGEAKVEQREFAQQVLLSEGVAVVVDEGKWATDGCLSGRLRAQRRLCRRTRDQATSCTGALAIWHWYRGQEAT